MSVLLPKLLNYKTNQTGSYTVITPLNLQLSLSTFSFRTPNLGALRRPISCSVTDFNMILQLLLGLALAWWLYSDISLARNFDRAQAIGVPLIKVPVSPMNFPWILMKPLVFRILDPLPFELGSFGRYGRRGWHFQDKVASHLELGDAFALVKPREIFLHICNPEAINEIFFRRQDFVRPVRLYSKASFLIQALE